MFIFSVFSLGVLEAELFFWTLFFATFVSMSAFAVGAVLFGGAKLVFAILRCMSTSMFSGFCSNGCGTLFSYASGLLPSSIFPWVASGTNISGTFFFFFDSGADTGIGCGCAKPRFSWCLQLVEKKYLVKVKYQALICCLYQIYLFCYKFLVKVENVLFLEGLLTTQCFLDLLQ